jgi:hypothetical protein
MNIFFYSNNYKTVHFIISVGETLAMCCTVIIAHTQSSWPVAHAQSVADHVLHSYDGTCIWSSWPCFTLLYHYRHTVQLAMCCTYKGMRACTHTHTEYSWPMVHAQSTAGHVLYCYNGICTQSAGHSNNHNYKCFPISSNTCYLE